MTAYTLTEYQRLKKAYATGAERVQYEDRSVLYTDRNEMRALLDEMERELGLKTKPASSGNRLRSSYTRGT